MPGPGELKLHKLYSNERLVYEYGMPEDIAAKEACGKWWLADFATNAVAEDEVLVEGKAYLVINTSWDAPTTVELPKEAEVYALTGKTGMRSRTMCLNGSELVLGENDQLPALNGVTVPAGKIEVAPGGCTFIIL